MTTKKLLIPPIRTRPYPDYPDREYTVSSDPSEWSLVERLLPPELVPPVPEKERYPSGFVPPRAKAGEDWSPG